jgi:3-phenylpropionate/trans-cinnamate dioxygenase ferredoxin subunit
VDDCSIECWLHGSRFDLRTGEALSLPATAPVPVFDVIVEGDGASARVLVAEHPATLPQHAE